MMDYLAYLSHHNITNFQSSAIILNSTAMKEEGLKAINSKNFKKAFFFLDNDESGKQALEYFSENINIDYQDCSGVYKGFNDYNEFLI